MLKRTNSCAGRFVRSRAAGRTRGGGRSFISSAARSDHVALNKDVQMTLLRFSEDPPALSRSKVRSSSRPGSGSNPVTQDRRSRGGAFPFRLQRSNPTEAHEVWWRRRKVWSLAETIWFELNPAGGEEGGGHSSHSPSSTGRTGTPTARLRFHVSAHEVKKVLSSTVFQSLDHKNCC